MRLEADIHNRHIQNTGSELAQRTATTEERETCLTWINGRLEPAIQIMNICVYRKGVDEPSFAQRRSSVLFNALHFIVCIGIHQSQLVQEETVVQDSDGIR